MCFGWFAILSPCNLDWIKGDPMRGVMSFMGTVHHSDAAMDILIALSAAIALLAFRNFCWRNIFLLAGVLSATFMWHSREFFQVAIYAGIFGITMLLFPNTDKKLMLKKWFAVMAIFAVVAIFFFSVMSAMVPSQPEGYDEFKVKKVALKYAFLPENITGIRNLFNIPFHMTLTCSYKPDYIIASDKLPQYFRGDWNFNLWLILSAIAIPFMSLFGKEEDKKLSLFYLLLWFLVLSWNFSMLIIVALTYSEIYITTPRIIYIFSYIIIANAIYLISRVFYCEKFRCRNFFIFATSMLGAGFLFCCWWKIGLPCAKPLSLILSICALFSFILLLIPKFARTHSFILLLIPKFVRTHSLRSPIFAIVLSGLFLFFLPILGKAYTSIIPKVIKESRASIEWFGDNNPFGFSSKLINYVRSLPLKQTFLVNPLGNTCIQVYTSQYAAVVPEIISTIIRDSKILAEARDGKHPLFSTQSARQKRAIKEGYPVSEYQYVNHSAAKDWLNRYNVDYILIEEKFYLYLLPYFRKFPQDYDIVFNNSAKKELIVHYIGKNEVSINARNEIPGINHE